VRRNGVVRAMDKELSRREYFIEYRSFEKVKTEWRNFSALVYETRKAGYKAGFLVKPTRFH